MTAPFRPEIQSVIDAAAAEAPALRSLSVKAGKRIMEVYGRDFSVTEKDDASPLTEADLASHRTVAAGLAALPSPLSELPLISEEDGLAPWEERREWAAWWLIDPLDGTKEFVKRNGEFTVNIALMVRPSAGAAGIPAAGWVYAPVPDILYEGIAGLGAKRIVGAGGSGREESLPAETPQVPPRIVASRSHRSPETELAIDAVAARFGRGDIVSSGSSLKLCRVAEGSAEFYPRCAPTMEWDTAAADAVCRAAGARVVHAHAGEELAYGKEELLNHWFLVSRDDGILDAAVSSLNE